MFTILSILTLAVYFNGELPVVGGQLSAGEEQSLGPAAGRWTVQQNAAAGVAFAVPPGMREVHGGQLAHMSTYSYNGGEFRLTVAGGRISDPSANELELRWRAAQLRPERTITYQLRTGTSFVLAGVRDDGRQFYDKVLLRNGRLGVISISYPGGMRDFDSWVNGISRSLTFLEERPRGQMTAAHLELPEVVADEPAPVPQAAESSALVVAESYRDGFVISPYDERQRLVDVRGMPAGSTVRCPYTLRVFQLP